MALPARRQQAGPAPAFTPGPRAIQAALLALLEERGATTACPSEVARRLSSDNWRALMVPVREIASKLQERGLVDAYQRGRAVQIASARGPIRLRARAAATIDHRQHPGRYRIGRGEEGVLTVEPYKSELLPLWRFATPALATVSSAAIWKQFRKYGRQGDFVGMDMARKYLQMGWTRARRYANHPGGRKYDPSTGREKPRREDPEKARAAAIFKTVYDRARADATYLRLRATHLAL